MSAHAAAWLRRAASLLVAIFGAGCDAEARVTAAAPAATLTPMPTPERALRTAAAAADRFAIADLVAYPLPRPFPLAPVRDRADFLQRFDELLPAELLTTIVHSNEGDWAQVGWRGTMLQNGRLWLDEHGRMHALNENSPAERNRWQALVERDRNALHKSLRGHAEPVLCWQTKGYRVRVDRMAGGSLRYSSWRRTEARHAAPDLVLHEGEIRVEGTARNTTYGWQSGDIRYECVDLHIHGDDSAPLELLVWRAGTCVLREAAAPLYPE